MAPNRIIPKKILFATFPADGHVNPLTGLAVYLKRKGHDVRWYTQDVYAEKLQRLDIPHYPFNHALQFTINNVDETFPARKAIKGQIQKLKFDMMNVFIERAPEYYRDIKMIHQDFEFDIMVADIAFTGIPFVKVKLRKPVIAVGVLPLIETSKDLPPSGLGLQPSNSWLGKLKQSFLRGLTDQILFKAPNKLFRKLLAEESIEAPGSNTFDILIGHASLVLQSGTPGFEYKRSDLGKNIRFIGPLLPYTERKGKRFVFPENLSAFEKIVLVTQGTAEKDTSKLIAPALKAFSDTRVLVIVTTGGADTEKLRMEHRGQNFIIEDFIPFADVMPKCDLFITNGGYGGVMLAIQHNLPLIVAGVHEGKNEINARVEYFKLGINLGTEKPKAEQIKKAAQKVFADPMYKTNVENLAFEFSLYDPNSLMESYLYELSPIQERHLRETVL